MAGPGRPRKNSVDKVEETKINLSEELTHLALGMHKNSQGRWVVCKIKYDPITKTVGEITEEVHDHKSFAIGQYKILSAKDILGGQK